MMPRAKRPPLSISGAGEMLASNHRAVPRRGEEI
jgi:hypothetical protein